MASKLKALVGQARKALDMAGRSRVTVGSADAYRQYRETGEILVSDATLEVGIAELLDPVAEVEDFALYGFGDVLHLRLHGVRRRVPFEALLTIAPRSVDWRPEYRVSFDVRVESWRVRRGATADLALDVVMDILPVPGIVMSLVGMAVDRLVSSIGLGRLAAWSAAELAGVSFRDGVAIVDLRSHSTLSVLAKPVVVPPGVPRVIASRIAGACPGDLIDLRQLRASRDGLQMKVVMSEQALGLFRFAAGVGAALDSG